MKPFVKFLLTVTSYLITLSLGIWIGYNAIPNPTLETDTPPYRGISDSSDLRYPGDPPSLDPQATILPPTPAFTFVIDAAFEDSRSIYFYATPEKYTEIQALGYGDITPHDSLSDAYVMYVNGLYDFEQVILYLQTLER